jgi:hypothetical protein
MKALALFLAALAVSAIAGTTASSAAIRVPELCRGDFEATVRVGTHKGFSVTGVLKLRISSSGAVAAFITSGKRASVKVVGHATGRAISFAINLRTKGTLYGSGAGRLPIAMCKGDAGGVFAGPGPGDVGDWGIKHLACPS